jgi:opacity protein-like surface antigen
MTGRGAAGHTAVALAMAALLLAPAAASAGAPPSGGGSRPHEWEVIISPYIWGTAIKGDVSAGSIDTDVDVPFRDILRDLSIAGMAGAEVRRDRFLLLLDAFGASLSTKVQSNSVVRSVGPLSYMQGPILIQVPQVDAIAGPVRVKTNLDQVLFGADLGYRALSLRMAELIGTDQPEDPRRLTVDLLAGIRWWWLQSRVHARMPPIQVPGFTIDPSIPAFPNLELPGISVPGVTFGGFQRTVTETQTWVDPVFGLRGRIDVTRRISLFGLGDVGGFSWGSGSAFTWQALGGVSYRLGEHWSLGAAYRIVNVRRDHAHLSYKGPLVGASYRF